MQISIIKFLKDRSIYIVATILLILSTVSALYYFSDAKNLFYSDSLARMNIARKITDNLTPGIAQLGNVWLPLPQLIMIPLTLNDYLWQSGLAGALMSASFFVIGGVFLYKSSMLLTEKTMPSLVAILAYALNINMLYLQTTAMSEAAFVGMLSIFSYYIILWSKSGGTGALLASAATVSLLTLIRYEGLAILFASILYVGIKSYASSRTYRKTEGNLVLFSTLAVVGFILWSFYLAVIFGDPLYWKNYYVSTSEDAVPLSSASVQQTRSDFLYSVLWYFTSVVWMNGMIPVLFALIGTLTSLFTTVRKRSIELFPVFTMLSIFVFMILTLMRNTPISQPVLTWSNLLSGDTNNFVEFNIRYGILMLPYIVLILSILLNKARILMLFFIILLPLQIWNYFTNDYTSIFQLDKSIAYFRTIQSGKQANALKWFKANYDQGEVLISAAKHDSVMFRSGLNLKNFIHEGTGIFWTTSLVDPSVYAEWVFMDYDNKDDTKDRVANSLKDSEVLAAKYDLVYSSDGMHIYKNKN